MAAAAIGSVWKSGSWSNTCWEENTWDDAELPAAVVSAIPYIFKSKPSTYTFKNKPSTYIFNK